MGFSIVALASLALGVAAQSTAGAYGQCGGVGSYYAQCYPGAATSSVATSSSAGSTSIPASTTSSRVSTTASTSKSTTTFATSTTSTAGAGSGSGSGTGTTLLSGWYWIRGVESPYYHSYLQALPTASAGTALLDSYLTAGQFNIIDGQLVYNTGSGTTSALYLNVEDPTDKTQRALATTFKTTKNTYGSFAFSGDTVTWTDPDVARPNTAAFYVCPGTSATGANALYINTGAYLYQTPSGCYDVDIHYYGGSTANL
ncbi:hypothetical protein J7T55_000635 [Diaporthe amygdali]|uniref:uncharacterized protein n=1 Tax=Phomopsis amygdali TaxID=1214568 RepID=UPI0022FE41FC|nr:uncharacterized protein J7T55_000635 [Diaporthe amygdali]KAJ0110203.1 hypothetical protein J7T55_000635 [Diaporthe amygdali]